MGRDDKVTETPFHEYSSFQESLVDFVKRLTAILDEMPEESRANAQFEFEGGGYDETGKIEVRYTRRKTDYEIAKERADEIASEEQYRRRQEARDRTEYERLRKKFG